MAGRARALRSVNTHRQRGNCRRHQQRRQQPQLVVVAAKRLLELRWVSLNAQADPASPGGASPLHVHLRKPQFILQHFAGSFLCEPGALKHGTLCSLCCLIGQAGLTGADAKGVLMQQQIGRVGHRTSHVHASACRRPLCRGCCHTHCWAAVDWRMLGAA